MKSENNTVESQNKRILRALQNGQKLTPLEMLRRFGTLRASGRIYDLRDAGHNIITERVSVPGHKHVAQYSLVS